MSLSSASCRFTHGEPSDLDISTLNSYDPYLMTFLRDAGIYRYLGR